MVFKLRYLIDDLFFIAQNIYFSVRYPNINKAWEYFSNLFAVTGGLLSYTPVFRDYFTQTLQELKDDNVQYLELRGLMLPVS